MRNTELTYFSAMPRLLLDGLGVGLALVEAQTGRVLYSNKLFGSMFGLNSSEVLMNEASIFELVHPEERDQHAKDWDSLVNDAAERASFDRRFLRSDGSVIWSHTTITPLKNENEVEWMACAFEDITEHKALAEKLQIAERLTGLATWNLSVADRVSETSSRYKAIFGLAETSPGNPSLDEFFERVHPDDRKAVQSTIRRALNGSPYVHEYRIIRANGEVRWLRGMATIVRDADGTVTNLIGATMDITDARSGQMHRPAPKSIQNFIDYIELNWNKPLSISDTARQFGINPRSLHKHFSARGMTPLGLLKRKKLQQAHKMLSHPDRTTSITRVAYECGFGNLGHFARDYREEFGELPSETLSRNKE